VTITYFAFRGMVTAGFLMVGLALLSLLLVVTKRLTRYRWILALLTPALFLPYIANTAGWLMTNWGASRGWCTA